MATGAPEPASRVQLFQSVLALLARLARSGSTVLVIEDIHWADRSTRRSGVLHERLARYVRDTADVDQALQLVRRAVDLVPSEPPSTDRARVLAGLAGQLMTDG